MDDLVEKYLINSGTSQRIAARLSAKLQKHEDLYEECCSSIKVCGFPSLNGIAVEGYTAHDIAELAPFMNIVGVYGFLASLRDDPESALLKIRQGFPRK